MSNSNCEEKIFNKMEELAREGPVKSYVLYNDVYYFPFDKNKDTKKTIAVKRTKDPEFKYEVIGIIDNNKLPLEVQKAIPILEKRVTLLQYKRILKRLNKQIEEQLKDLGNTTNL